VVWELNEEVSDCGTTYGTCDYPMFRIATTLIPVKTILTFCGNNLFHQTKAANVLTMKECLDCHDSITAKPIRTCLGNECIYLKEHPIMSPYPPPKGAGSRFAPRIEIEQAGCILEEGKTTCLSCHDLTKPPPRIIKEVAELCPICHIGRRENNYKK
jgi:hypothetical protein